MRNRTLFLVAAAALAGAALTGCAQQIGDIDRTQPNRLEKTAFEGEWYMLQTVVDINGTAVSTFPGLIGELERIRFEITEDDLIARRMYEDVTGADTSGIGLPDDISFDGGSPIAAFGVSHFDIIRSYNSSTGEESNVIVENSSDRPWNEREYVRVSWDRNRVDSDVDPMIPTSHNSYVSVPPQEHTDEPTWFVERDEDGQVTYIDVLNTYVVQPDWWSCLLMQGFPNWGGSCGPETVQIRTSFQRITEDVASDHIARVYDDWDMNRFGFFRTNRAVFDRRYGTRDDSRVSIANTWNIWERSTDDDGNVIPRAERTPRPIAYYLNTEMPVDLYDENFEIAEQWSAAFLRTVAGVRGVRVADLPIDRMFYICLNPGSTDPAVPDEYMAHMRTDEDRALLTEMFAASAFAYDNGICDRPGVEKNIGDLRYSFFNWVNNHPGAPWLGYGPSAADPLTGEIRTAGANINGQSVDTYAQYTLDLVNLINGDLDPIDLGYGRNIAGYFDELRERSGDARYGYLRVQGDDDDNKRVDVPSTEIEIDTSFEQDFIRRRTRELAETRDAIEHVLSRPSFQALRHNPLPDLVRQGSDGDPMRVLRDTPIEQRVMFPEVTQALGQLAELGAARAGETLTEEERLAWTSPLRVGTPQALRDRYERTHANLLNRNIMMGADFDAYLVGFATEMATLANELEAQGLDDWEIQEQLWLQIRGSIYRAVQEHEVGHTVGLRHNFSASADAMNFHPQYWALREMTFNEDCEGDGYRTFTPDGFISGLVAPERCADESSEAFAARSADVLNAIRTGRLDDGTQYQSMHHYQYASIMDYDPKPNTHNAGLGLYDYAAIAYGYGDLIEVFDTAPNQISVDVRYDDRTEDFESITIARAGTRVVDMNDVDDYNIRINGQVDGDLPPRPGRPDDEDLDDNQDNPWNDWHYSVLPIMFQDDAATFTADDPANDYHELIDFTHVGSMASMYSRRLVPADQVDSDPAQFVEVPYNFCSDYYRGTQWDCDVWDIGADQYEILDNIRNSYESYYVVDMFRRQRLSFGFDPFSQLNRMWTRYFEPAKRQYQFWYLGFAGEGYPWIVAENGGDNGTTAAFDAIDFIASVITTPSVGTYVYDQNLDRYMNINDDIGIRLESFDPDYPDTRESDYIDLGYEDGARYGFSRFHRNEDDELGYYSSLFQYDIMSHFWAKWPALITLLTGDVQVAGADTSSDQSAYYLPPFLLFEEDVMNFLGSIIAEDFRDTGWCVNDVDGKMEVEAIDMIRGQATGDVCRDNGGIIMNPYTEAYGNGDYNMRYYATIYSAAYIQETLDKSWMDNGAVYIWGRGEQPELLDTADYDYLTYTDDLGISYAARYEVGYDPTNLATENVNVGYQLIQSLIDLRVERDFACPFEFQGDADDLLSECGMTRAEADQFIEDNSPYNGRDYYEVFYDLEGALEMVKFQNELGLVFNSF